MNTTTTELFRLSEDTYAIELHPITKQRMSAGYLPAGTLVKDIHTHKKQTQFRASIDGSSWFLQSAETAETELQITPFEE